MTITKDIEYVLVDGKPSVNPSDFTDERDIEVMAVQFEAHPRWEDDGIGSYEYWGCKGYDSRPYVSCEHYGIEWDKAKHTDEENEIIDAWLSDSDNFEHLENRFCENFKNYCEY